MRNLQKFTIQTTWSPKIKLLEVPKTNFKMFTFQTLIILILVILKWMIINLIISYPVSYTHLDVYKRQEQRKTEKKTLFWKMQQLRCLRWHSCLEQPEAQYIQLSLIHIFSDIEYPEQFSHDGISSYEDGIVVCSSVSWRDKLH